MIRKLAQLSCTLTLCANLFAQSYAEVSSVQMQAAPSEGAGVTLTWTPLAGTTSLELSRRKRITDAFTFFVHLPLNASTYVDASATANDESYEYRIRRRALVAVGGSAAKEYVGEGYVLTSRRLPAVHHRGRLLRVVEAEVGAELTTDLEGHAADAQADGYVVETAFVQATDAVTSVKTMIAARYAEHPEERWSLMLIGHVPVPYSGLYAPDGHTNHKGAWPADVYYAELDEARWTDASATVAASDNVPERNANVPGDGRFDQDIVSGFLELEVGRVDMSQLPNLKLAGETERQTEVRLTRDYFERLHAFRRVLAERPPERGLYEDNFGNMAEGFSQSALRTYAAAFGAEGNVKADFSTLKTERYLWGYGAGAGSQKSAGGIVSVNDFRDNDYKATFVMLFGSYFGDWDAPDNLLRTAIAKGEGLASAWVGRPHWPMHRTALGASLGECARLAQGFEGNVYIGGFGTRGRHVALLGDPTLRTFYPKPTAGLSLEPGELPGTHSLSWTASEDANAGYYVYLKDATDGTFERLTDTPTKTTQFALAALPTGDHTFVVRTAHLRTTASGVYEELSLGTEIDVTLAGPVSSTRDGLAGLSAPWPNPIASGTDLWIEAAAAGELRIADMAGRVLRRAEVPVGRSSVSTDEIAAGVYAVTVSGRTTRLVIY